VRLPQKIAIAFQFCQRLAMMPLRHTPAIYCITPHFHFRRGRATPPDATIDYASHITTCQNISVFAALSADSHCRHLADRLAITPLRHFH